MGKKLVQAIRQDKTMDAVKRMRRSPAVHALKRKLREIQDDIWAGKATLFEAPAVLLNSSEWAVAVAQLREACPCVAETSSPAPAADPATASRADAHGVVRRRRRRR